jgi:hypothetical protein
MLAGILNSSGNTPAEDNAEAEGAKPAELIGVSQRYAGPVTPPLIIIVIYSTLRRKIIVKNMLAERPGPGRARRSAGLGRG